MSSTNIQSSAFPDSKGHYDILDGLRGVAAVMVVAFHILEPHSTSPLDQIINHGYLAVEFFLCPFGFCYRLCLRRPMGKNDVGWFFQTSSN